MASILTPVASGPGQAASIPARSDAGQIAFVSNRDGNPEIYLMNADGSGLQNLTNGPADDYSPVWSPDGSRLAFVSRGSGRSDIYVLDADGSVLNLTDHPSDNYSPAWSPDGTRIAFVSSRKTKPDQWMDSTDIFVIHADGSQLTDLASGEKPIWSPDGQTIAFLHFGEIFRIALDGGSRKLLRASDNADYASDLSWSPDGHRLLFSNSGTGEPATDLWLMSGDGSQAAALTVGGDTWKMSPEWSPDGRQIAYFSGGEGNNQIYVIDADGSDASRLTHDEELDISPAWSPDGSQIAYFATPKICVTDAGGRRAACFDTGIDSHFDYQDGPAWRP
jgi:TolB protein